MLSTTTIDAIKDLAVEHVLSKYLTLKPSGIHLKGCCPLHGEKTPSLMVSKVKNNWQCYGCGAGGDAIQFVMLHDNLPFIEACKSIASDNGIAIEEKELKGKTPEQKKDEDGMLVLMQQANNLYRKSINTDTVKYLINERNLTRETIIEWQLGLCADWRVFTDQVTETANFTPALKIGLVKESNGKNYDFFHHRITIPMHDKVGQVIGFGGRKYSGEGPKYLNPPESDLYQKSKTLFGLHRAIRNFKKHGMAVLVEGYFDVIKLHQCGWNNTVASCGTALTEQHAKLLKRYTDTVLILRDGDQAGLNAIDKDIAILAEQQFNILVVVLPAEQDPDSLFDNVEKMVNVLWNYSDGIEYLCSKYLQEGLSMGASGIASGIEKTVRILSLLTNQVRIEQNIKNLAKKFSLKPAELSKPLSKYIDAIKREKEEAAEENRESEIPAWVDKGKLEDDGFVQLVQATKGFKPGIYFRAGEGRMLYRTTNFTLKPLYHIYEQSNNRRLVEVNNCVRSAVVEMPNQAFINQNAFEAELMSKGNFHCDFAFTKKEFKRVIGWLSFSMPIAYELKTLGWQPEGFFAYSDAVFTKGNLIHYDEMGMVRIEDKFYMSLGKSKIHRDERATDNPYENDLYLSHKSSKINFERWAELFNLTYGDNAPYGIAFAFMTLFKDIMTRVSKMPMLYCYGPKGSGKSAMAESLTWLFFSGKNAEGDLIKGYNLNPGQGTPFSFFNRVERFRNCPILMNEFDENNIEDWKFGTFKAAYDGEGREVGDGDTGKKRKTRIQKVQGTVLLVGQYLSIKDDGSVLSRSVSCQFSLERLSNLTADQIKAHESLKEAETEGLSGLLADLLKYRDDVAKKLPEQFANVRTQLSDETRKAGHRIEERLLNNYSLVLSATKMMGEWIKLPYTYDDFFLKAKRQIVEHNKLLKNNSAIHQFWKSVEFLFDTGILLSMRDLKIMHGQNQIRLRDGSATKFEEFSPAKSLVLVRFSNVYAQYSKYQRERTGKIALPEDTLLLYMQEQPYYIGYSPSVYFSDKTTSAYVFDYDKMNEFGIVLEKHFKEEEQTTAAEVYQNNPIQPAQLTLVPTTNKTDDLPF